MSDEFDAPQQAPTREFDRFGRRLLPEPGGDSNNIIPWTRATTLASTIDDMWNLQQWQLRMVAHGLGQRPDLYSLAAALDPESEKGDLQKVCNDAMEAAQARAGANMGTALHSFTHTLDRTGGVDAPEMWRGHLDVYRRGMDESPYRLSTSYIERVCVNTQIKTAGQFDRLLVPPVEMDSDYVIGDLKTEKGDFEYSMRRIAIQLAIYANSDFIWDPATRTYAPMPSVDRSIAVVMHLPATGPPRFQLYEVDIAAGWEAVQLALDVRIWRKRKGLMRPLGQPLTGATAGAHQLRGRELASAGAKTVLSVEHPATGELDLIAPPVVAPTGPTEPPSGDGVPTPAVPVETVSADRPSSDPDIETVDGGLEPERWLWAADAVTSRAEASALWRAAVAEGAWTAELENACKKALDKLLSIG